MANDGSIIISGGDININGYDFVTLNYQPPSYSRAITFTDVPMPSADHKTITMTRTVDDLGPMLGSWKAFTIQAYNSDMYDQGDQAHRGELIFQNLQSVFQTIGQAIRLWDYWLEKEYWVMFDSSGLSISYAAPTRAAGRDPLTDEPLGGEFDITISLFEVPAPTND